MKLLIANLKMNLNTVEEVEKYQKEMEKYKNNFVVAPQNIYLENFKNKGFIVASQNSSNYDDGPHTGEISPKSLKDMKVKYTIIGHSEIRNKYKDENKYIKDKVEKALKNGLMTILCIGENDEKSDVLAIIEKQLIDIKPSENLIISYEPAWAIGKDKTPSNIKLEEIISFIKSKGHKKVLYGGSVNDKNIEILNKLNLDGFLIGTASLDKNKMSKIIEVVK